jgi:riboflavin synthase
MFTGIIEEVGIVEEAASHRLLIGATTIMSDLAVSHSIAVNGVCLTVVEAAPSFFAVELSEETVRRTNLGKLARGTLVNLERALAVGGRMGGHRVQGHVDGVGTVLELGGPPQACVLRVDIPAQLHRYVVEKGFLAVEGISLTVASMEGTAFSVAVIPYTLEQTNLRSRGPGDMVNLEVDILAKYVEKLLRGDAAKPVE